MDRKRKLSEISSNNSYLDVGKKQIKQEFPELNCAGNDSHLASSKDQNALKLEKTRASQHILPLNKNLSHSHITIHKLEEHWKQGLPGMRYFIDDSHPKSLCDQNTSIVESKRISKNMLPRNDNLLHNQFQMSHDEHCKHGLQEINYISNNQLAIVAPDQNTRLEKRKNINNGLLSLNNTSSQELHRKIFINGNLVGLVGNKDGIKKLYGIESNFQKGYNAYQAYKGSPTNVHTDILPLVEILSKNLYRKITISENFISIVLNVPRKKTKKRSRKNKYTWKNPNLKAQQTITQKSLIASADSEKSLHKDFNENQSVNNIARKDQACAYHGNNLQNDSNLKIAESQTTNEVGPRSDGKKIILPSDSISKSLYRKIFFIGNFIGIVRNIHNETENNVFLEMKHVTNVQNYTFSGELQIKETQNTGSMIEEASRKRFEIKRKELDIHYGNQKSDFQSIGYVKTEPNTTVTQYSTQIDSDEISSESLLPLIKILSKNLYREITVGKKFIKILENIQGEKQMPRSNVKGFVRYFNRKRHGRNMSYTSHLMKNTQKFPDVSFNVEQSPLSKTLPEKSQIQNTVANYSNYGSNRISYASNGRYPTSFQNLNYHGVRKPTVERFPVVDNIMPTQKNQNGLRNRRRGISRQTRSPQNGSYHTFARNQISQEAGRTRPTLKVELLGDNSMYKRSVQIRQEKHWNLGHMMNHQRNKPHSRITQDQITWNNEGSSTNKAIVSLSQSLTNKRDVIFSEGDYGNDGLYRMNYIRNEMHSKISQDQIIREVARDTISRAILSLSDCLRNNQQVRLEQEEYWNNGLVGMCPQNLYFP